MEPLPIRLQCIAKADVLVYIMQIQELIDVFRFVILKIYMQMMIVQILVLLVVIKLDQHHLEIVLRKPV